MKNKVILLKDFHHKITYLTTNANPDNLCKNCADFITTINIDKLPVYWPCK